MEPRHVWSQMVILVAFAAAAVPGFAAPLFDDFDGPAIDPQWTVQLEGTATGYTHNFSSSWLNVTDITTSARNTTADVVLSQAFCASGDFLVEALIGWDSAGLDKAMQNMYISLSSAGTSVASVGYHDAWYYDRGERRGSVGATSWGSGKNSLAFAGTGTVAIARHGGVMSVSWNGSEMVSDLNDALIDTLQIRFTWNTFQDGSLSSIFGAESIEYIQAEAVPEPSLLILFGSGVAVVALARRFAPRR